MSQLAAAASRAAPTALVMCAVISSAEKPCCDASNDIAHRRAVERTQSNDTGVGARSGRREDRRGWRSRCLGDRA